jgi:hypothetical protein
MRSAAGTNVNRPTTWSRRCRLPDPSRQIQKRVRVIREGDTFQVAHPRSKWQGQDR